MSENTAPAVFGRYQVLEELGAGAMGVVYLCVDPRLTRPVAVKVLKEAHIASAPEREHFRERFRREAEAAGRLNHPGIVQIYDVGPSYLVMEFLEGRTLRSALQGGVRLAVRRIVEIVRLAAEAIDFAHRHGIVHRDVKPANIMLLDDGGLKVMDFGVARLDTSNLTAVGTVMGSVRYMAPEQMMGERVDGRADIFSLAAVAYELLTGRAPFPGKTITDVVSRVVHGSHVPPGEVDPRLPEGLNEVFAQGFATRPEDRYVQAGDLARDLLAAAGPVLDLEILHAGEQGREPSGQATTVKGEAVTTTPAPGNLPTTPPPTVHGAGLVQFESDPPGALVYLDSKPVGRTPLASVDVSFGRHLVRMEAEGRQAVTATVEVKAERPLRVLSFTLPIAVNGMALPAGHLVPFGPDVTPPRRVSGPVPVYPAGEQARGLEGAPVVELWVGETGHVINAAVVESAGEVLDGALLAAAMRWRFTPAMLRGVPVTVRITVQHHFRR